jgi:hypothetical protein
MVAPAAEVEAVEINGALVDFPMEGHEAKKLSKENGMWNSGNRETSG